MTTLKVAPWTFLYYLGDAETRRGKKKNNTNNICESNISSDIKTSR